MVKDLFRNVGFIFFSGLLMCVFIASGCAASGVKENVPAIDKSADKRLQNLVAKVAPQFVQAEFKSEKGNLAYSLFSPEKMEKGKKYPLVLFMADASTVGTEVTMPLTQGYGALVFASPEAQAKNPCFVLVPQFSKVVVNDAYELDSQVDLILPLLNEVAGSAQVDSKKIYATGQSMGGMISMYLMSEMPEVFAASLFVDSHWSSASLDRLVKHPFIFVYAGTTGKSYKCEQEIEAAARKMSSSYAWAEWSAALPMQTQDDLALNVLGKGNPINLIGFENGTVLPESGKGSEHMYSFDKAYQLAPLREWLFTKTLAK